MRDRAGEGHEPDDKVSRKRVLRHPRAVTDSTVLVDRRGRFPAVPLRRVRSVNRSLNCEQALTALDEWTGRGVAVRVVGGGDELLVVFAGILAERTADKHPAWFWPVLQDDPTKRRLEQPGIYLHPGLFEDALLHEGAWVLELRQAGVTLNLRRL